MPKHICKRSAKDEAIIAEASQNIAYWTKKYQESAAHRCPEIKEKIITVEVANNTYGWVAIILLLFLISASYCGLHHLAKSMDDTDAGVSALLEDEIVFKDLQEARYHEINRERLNMDPIIEKLSATIENGEPMKADRLAHKLKVMNDE